MALLENQFAQQRLSRMIKQRKETFNKRTGSPPGKLTKKVTSPRGGWMVFSLIFLQKGSVLFISLQLAQACREQVNQSFWHFPDKLGRVVNPEEYRSEQILRTLDEDAGENADGTINTIELINQKQLYARMILIRKYFAKLDNIRNKLNYKLETIRLLLKDSWI